MSELEAIVQMITARLEGHHHDSWKPDAPQNRQLEKQNHQNVPAPPESNEFPMKASLT